MELNGGSWRYKCIHITACQLKRRWFTFCSQEAIAQRPTTSQVPVIFSPDCCRMKRGTKWKQHFPTQECLTMISRCLKNISRCNNVQPWFPDAFPMPFRRGIVKFPCFEDPTGGFPMPSRCHPMPSDACLLMKHPYLSISVNIPAVPKAFQWVN